MKLRQAKKIINFIIKNKQNSKWFKHYENYLNISCLRYNKFNIAFIHPSILKALAIVYKFDYNLYKKYNFISKVDKLNIECNIVATLVPETVIIDTDNI